MTRGDVCQFLAGVDNGWARAVSGKLETDR